jgi:hypothetical protein
MKKTLLEMVQDVLNDIDGDEVNSIDDTVESEQVANIIRSTFESLIASRDWPHLRKVTQLVASGDSTKPVNMTTPANTSVLEHIQYNKKKTGETQNKFKEVTYMFPDDFLRYTNKRNNDNSNVSVITDISGVTLHILTDKHPEYYTSFDEENLVFDSYDSAVDTTLQASKTQAIIYQLPTFSLTDAFVPDLPAEQFAQFVEESKSRCSAKLRQTADQKSESWSQRLNNRNSRAAWKTHEGGKIRYPNYGRR